MLKTITKILPFLIATLLAVGWVVQIYRLMEHYLLLPPAAKVEESGEPTALVRMPTAMERHRNYDVIVERNLFGSYTVEEQPQIEVEENPLAGLETTRLDLVLMGTVSGEAGNSRAIILDKRENTQEIYYQGDVIEGAEIKEILRGKVILSYEGKDEILDMSEAASMRPNIPNAAPSPYESEVFNQPPPTRPQAVDPDIDPAALETDEEAFLQGVEENLEPGPLEYPEEPVEEGSSIVGGEEDEEPESQDGPVTPRRRIFGSEPAE